jgi:succinate dehydrogenase/fumarate reductase flavoprotein subunit
MQVSPLHVAKYIQKWLLCADFCYTSAMPIETDVLVIGAGAAGAAAAIAARDAGAEVVLAERAAAPGGNCRHSGGFLVQVGGPEAIDHVDALCFGKTPRDVIASYVDGLGELPGWLRDALGGTLSDPLPPMETYPWLFPSWPNSPGGREATYHLFDPGPGEDGHGERLWSALAGGLASRGVEPWLETRAVDLLQDGAGSVTGAVLERGGERTEIRARGGVVLACGSFEYDDAMRDAYLPIPLVPIGHPGNTGDGVRLAGTVDAALWHMSAFFGWFVFRAPDHDAGFPIDFHAPGYVLVDADGRRWSDETGWEVHDRVRSITTYHPRRPNFPHLPAYAIFDRAVLDAAALNGVVGTPNDYAWSADNRAELESGWIVDGEDAADLATKLGIPADTLAETLAAYDDATLAGHDPEFGRDPTTLVPFAPGPLYGIELWPGVATASGGPRRDGRARVVRDDGEPVGGLFAAGGCGSIWAHLTEHGGGLTDALVFGRLAGREAAGRRDHDHGETT